MAYPKTLYALIYDNYTSHEVLYLYTTREEADRMCAEWRNDGDYENFRVGVFTEVEPAILTGPKCAGCEGCMNGLECGQRPRR